MAVFHPNPQQYVVAMDSACKTMFAPAKVVTLVICAKHFPALVPHRMCVVDMVHVQRQTFAHVLVAFLVLSVTRLTALVH